MAMFSPHASSWRAVAEKFGVQYTIGLSSAEAKKRLRRFGKNVLARRARVSFLASIVSQLKSPLAFVLIIAGFVALYLRASTDATVIFLAVGINTCIGALQEGKAQRAFDALLALTTRKATVFRDGREQEIDAGEVVPGDILILSAGDKIAADARIVEQKALESNEAALTGEWVPSQKTERAIAFSKRITDQTNMVWMGTLVSGGWGRAIVVATGIRTEFGKIAALLKDDVRRTTPLQQSIKKLARFIGIAVSAIVVSIFIVGLLRGQSVVLMFLTAVAVAVAAIPEGLPVAVTVVLALGMQRILKRGGLVRKLIAAETLGSASVIMIDKTGTLTQGRMQISHIITPAEIYQYDGGQKLSSPGEMRLHHLGILRIGMLTSNAFIENPDDALAEWKIRGRPTDQALLLAGVQAGIDITTLHKEYRQLDILPFDSERRFSAAITRISKKRNQIFVAGAPETVLDISRYVKSDGKTARLTAEKHKKLRKLYERITASGIRMIGVAYRSTTEDTFPRVPDHLFQRFIFMGFIGFHDPIRKTVPEAVAIAQHAGLKVIMLTGDHAATAEAVARKVRIIDEHDMHAVMDGEAIERLPAVELKKQVLRTRVFARILPHQKMLLVRMFQEEGETVAMTGDGINDAPALRQADIGIALGSGTDVAKEAAEIVLLNNSFSVIVCAIEEGRVIIDNLRRIITYLLSTGVTEVILVGGALALGFPLPLLPAQILWANLVGEGFMNFAFAFEPKEADIMDRKPAEQSPKKFFTREMKYIIIFVGVLTDIFLFFIFLFLHVRGFSAEEIHSIVFIGLSIDSFFFAFSLKDLKRSIWDIDLFSNLYLVGALGISLFLLVAAMTFSPLQKLLGLAPLTFFEFSILLGLGMADLAAIESMKWYFIKKRRQ